MPYKTFWYKENQVVFAEFIGEFSIQEMYDLNRELDIYFKSDGNTIHLIADLRAMTNYPKNLAQVRDATRRTANQPGLGWVLLIGSENPFLKFLVTTVFQLVRVNCKIVGSLEDAEDILRRVQFADSQPGSDKL